MKREVKVGDSETARRCWISIISNSRRKFSTRIQLKSKPIIRISDIHDDQAEEEDGQGRSQGYGIQTIHIS